MIKYFILFVSLLHSSFGVSQKIEYPALYQLKNLPEYPNANVTEIGRSSSNLEDGIKIFLETADNYMTLRSFYENSMKELGWEMEESIAIQKMRQSGQLEKIPFSGKFIKDSLIFQASSCRVKDITKLNITLLKK